MVIRRSSLNSRAAKDPFKMLGLPRTATREDVKVKYRELAKLHHPDSGTHADARKMEEVNQAYNLLIKEGMHEALHIKKPSPVSRSSDEAEEQKDGAGPKSDPLSELDEEEREKAATLDPATERIREDGKFVYQCRATGEWIALSKPLAKPQHPRYNTYMKHTIDLSADIRQRAKEQEQFEETKSFLDRRYDKYRAWLPFENRFLMILTVLLYSTSVYFMYQRTFTKMVLLYDKWGFYNEQREHREKVNDVYELFKDEADVCTAASAYVFLAAALKADASRAKLPATSSDLRRKEPLYYKNIYNST